MPDRTAAVSRGHRAGDAGAGVLPGAGAARAAATGGATRPGDHRPQVPAQRGGQPLRQHADLAENLAHFLEGRPIKAPGPVSSSGPGSGRPARRPVVTAGKVVGCARDKRGQQKTKETKETKGVRLDY